MAMDGLPEGVPPSGRVPGQLLQAAPILKRRRRRYRGEFAKFRSILGVSTPRAKYRRRGAPGGPTSQSGGSLARPRVGPRISLDTEWQLSSLVTPSGRLDVDSSKFPSVKIQGFVSSRT